MEKVIFRQGLLDYLEYLTFLLFEKGYFGFEDSSLDYIGKIVDFIYNKIGTYPHKITPEKLEFLGKYYIVYKSNERTSWYIFFDITLNKVFLITNILNNHQPETRFLNL